MYFLSCVECNVGKRGEKEGGGGGEGKGAGGGGEWGREGHVLAVLSRPNYVWSL
jgi:hypothetical protein